MSYIKSYEVKTVVPYEGDERIFFENDSKSALERFIIELLRNEIVRNEIVRNEIVNMCILNIEERNREERNRKHVHT